MTVVRWKQRIWAEEKEKSDQKERMERVGKDVWEREREKKRAFRLKFYSLFKSENFSSNEDDNDDDASIKKMMLWCCHHVKMKEELKEEKRETEK